MFAVFICLNISGLLTSSTILVFIPTQPGHFYGNGKYPVLYSSTKFKTNFYPQVHSPPSETFLMNKPNLTKDLALPGYRTQVILVSSRDICHVYYLFWVYDISTLLHVPWWRVNWSNCGLVNPCLSLIFKLAPYARWNEDQTAPKFR